MFWEGAGEGSGRASETILPIIPGSCLNRLKSWFCIA
jgi:hypothetical protein